jgi:predicted TIM-barrel fold metal-dependent hydrolase
LQVRLRTDELASRPELAADHHMPAVSAIHFSLGLVPMHQPGEAIEELEFAVKMLGLKAAMLAGHVVRPIPAVAHAAPPEISRYAYWVDNLALDSAYDYDPVWNKCVELKMAATFHSSSYGWAHRTTGNYQYNQLGNFAETAHITCKALFFAGVTRRFPTLKFAFLECGAAWASALLSDRRVLAQRA